MENIREILAESYKKAISEVFNKDKSLFENKGKMTADKMEQAFYEFLDFYQTEKSNIENSWANTVVTELQGKTPSEIINGLDDIDDVYDLFLYMMENTDAEIPDLLINKMKQYGAGISERLINLARTSTDTDNQDHIFSETVFTIGRMGLSASIEPLISLLNDLLEDDQKSDYVEEALRMIGGAVIEPILAALEKDEFGEFEHRLLYVLANIGSNAKDERIYRILRKAFRESGDKLPVVVCFAAYKDGRAVPMLRSYLEKNGRDIPKQLFYTVMDTVNRLGGDIKDFMGMFREMDSKKA